MPDRDDDRTDIDRDLARLAAATDRLDVDDAGDRFTEAVLRAAKADDAAKAADDPLARIARATEGLAPDAAFTDAVLRAAKAAPAKAAPAPPAMADGIVRSGRAAIAVTALAAAASVLFFLQTQRDLDSAIMASVDTLEASE
ncbi:hypothetical protein [Sorangium cellulosum]|uniref:Uncharacterized protein n=1 Tax=Sorangium cellulosum TaxID=56 RepID=A0A150QIP3_SORCE|nr:hypothetical protein [Sorangium cellulosum]KYF67586.1 hypothetical protein BE15_06560 [Sorangium cellulosum]